MAQLAFSMNFLLINWLKKGGLAIYLFGLFSYPCLDSLGRLTAKRLEHSPGHALDMQTRDAVRREALWFQVHEDQASASIHSKGGDVSENLELCRF